MLSPALIWAAVKTLIFLTGLRFVGIDLVLDNRLVRDIFVSKYLCTRSFWSSFLVSQLIKLISLDQVFRYLENDFNRAPDFNSGVPSAARNLWAQDVSVSSSPHHLLPLVLVLGGAASATLRTQK